MALRKAEKHTRLLDSTSDCGSVDGLRIIFEGSTYWNVLSSRHSFMLTDIYYANCSFIEMNLRSDLLLEAYMSWTDSISEKRDNVFDIGGLFFTPDPYDHE